MLNLAKEIALGLVTTTKIFTLTLLFSLPLGLLITSLRLSKNKIISSLTTIYISVMRGTPLILQLFVVYFGPYFLFKIRLSNSYRFYAVIIGFTINYAAYFAEIYRGGILSIDKGQYEAAKLLGYSKAGTFFHIILPQVIRNVIPMITNEVITLVKDTSLAFVISVAEMFTVAKAFASSTTSMMPFVIAGVYYYIFNGVVAYVMETVEKKLAYY